jgi:hypothetical protein
VYYGCRSITKLQNIRICVCLSGVQAKNVVLRTLRGDSEPLRPCRNIILCFTDVVPSETGASVNVRYLCSDCRCTPEGDGYVGCCGMCAEPASAASTDVPSTGPPFLLRKSVWTVRCSTGPNPLDRPVFKVLSRARTFSSARVVFEDKRTAVSPSLKTCSLFKKITVVSRTDETVTFEVKAGC